MDVEYSYKWTNWIKDVLRCTKMHKFLKSLKMFQNAITKAILHKKMSEGLFSLMFTLSSVALFNQNYRTWLELWSIVKSLINILKSVKSPSVFVPASFAKPWVKVFVCILSCLGARCKEFVFSDKTVEDSQVVWARPSYGSRDLRRPWPWPKLPSLADTEEGHVC